MHRTRTDIAKGPWRKATDKLVGAVVEKLDRLVEVLVPRQQPQLVPVRVRAGRTPDRR